jgi:uncharacterized coiled-coil protein SlyX
MEEELINWLNGNSERDVSFSYPSLFYKNGKATDEFLESLDSDYNNELITRPPLRKIQKSPRRSSPVETQIENSSESFIKKSMELRISGHLKCIKSLEDKLHLAEQTITRQKSEIRRLQSKLKAMISNPHNHHEQRYSNPHLEIAELTQELQVLST